MSHQRYMSHDAVKEPHSVSVKVLRLSRPSLVTQYPIEPPFSLPSSKLCALPASLAYSSQTETNPSPFLLSPILNLPASFGSAYVGETFSCTLCANNEVPHPAPSVHENAGSQHPAKQIRDVRIQAEMKTPGLSNPQHLDLSPSNEAFDKTSTDLAPGETLQKIVNFDLKEEGNHVLAVTVSYYEASETSGRTRTFRKLYQFICKASLIVRTKVGNLGLAAAPGSGNRRRWVLEAQLENCSEDVMQLEKVGMEVDEGFAYQGYNWEPTRSEKPILQPGEVEQVCFVVEEQDVNVVSRSAAAADGRIVFGVLGIGWRGEMGNRGFLSTGKLGTRLPR